MTTLYDHDMEKWLIGALLQDEHLQKALPQINGELMHDEGNAAILEAMKRMQGAREPIDLMLTAKALEACGQSDKVGGAAYLLQCVSFCPSTANAKSYMAKLKELAKARKAFSIANELQHALMDGESTDAVIDTMRTKLRGMENDGARKLVRGSELASIVFDDVEARSLGEIQTLKIGVPDFDNLTGGLEQTDMVVVGARPSVGKSAFALETICNVAHRGERVLICSLEMSDKQYGRRMASRLSGVNSQRLKRGALDADDWSKLGEGVTQMSSMRICFDFDSRTVEELRSIVQDELDRNGLDLLVVDYMQIMQTSKRTNKRYEEVGTVSRELKLIARQLKVPVMVLAQVGRQGEQQKRAATKPLLSDLRESGNIEQDADIVLFLHRPESEDDPAIISGDKELFYEFRESGMQYIIGSVAKNRDGSVRDFAMRFDPPHMSYTCIDRGRKTV